MCRARILLAAVNMNCCFCCCQGDGWRDCSWLKLDWWHVRLVFRSLRRTGPHFFDFLYVWEREVVRVWVVCKGLGVSPCYSGWALASLCFCDRRGGHQLFQWLEVSEEISQLLEHSNPRALDTRWQIKWPPGRCWNTYWTLLPLICIAPQCEVFLFPTNKVNITALYSVTSSELIKHIHIFNHTLLHAAH